MPGLFNRLHTWAFEEILKSKELNAEFDNIINHMTAGFIGGDSTTLSQFLTQVNPGNTGSESLATTLAGEIERLRFQISAITGNATFNIPPILSLIQINSLLNLSSAISANRIISGKLRTTSHQPIFLHADGATPRVILKAAVTPFKVVIQGAESDFIVDTPLTLTTTAAVTAAIQATVDGNQDIFAGESDWTSPTLVIDNCGATIASLVGKYAAFKVVNGGSTEYFTAFIKSTTALTKCSRGYFFDSTDAPVQATALVDENVVTLLNLNYIFATSSLTLLTTTNPPTYSALAPAGASPGDMWFNLTTQVWSQFVGSAFVNSHATLIGLAATDNANCIVARSFEIFAAYNAKNTAIFEWISGTVIRSTAIGDTVNVAGNNFVWSENFLEFDAPTDNTDADNGNSLAATTTYYLYIKDTGEKVISSIRPFDRSYDLFGRYHRYSPWRLVGTVTTDGGSAFTSASLLSDQALPPNRGGTGLSFLSSGSVILGGGQSQASVVSAGASQNVLTSNGTAWVSTAPSGSYTPSFSLGTNIATSSASVSNFTRNGNIVLVQGSIDLSLTAANIRSFVDLSLPIASNFTQPSDASGGGGLRPQIDGIPGMAIIYGRASAQTVTFVIYNQPAGFIGNNSYPYTFVYVVK